MFLENVRLAVNGLRANKMRALLTMLGIIIGVASVITIVTVGQGMTSSVKNLLNDMGANSFQLYIQDRPDEHGNINWSRPYEREDMISQQMIDQYIEAFSDSIHAWAVSKSVGSGQAINGRNEAQGNVQGTNAGAIAIQNVPIIAGHFLNEREVSGGKSAIVISDRFAQRLYPNLSFNEVLGQEVKVRLNQGVYTFWVVGVYRYEISGLMGAVTGDTSTNLFIPVSVAEQITSDEKPGRYYSLQVKASDKVTDVGQFLEQTKKYFNDHFYRDNRYVYVRGQNMASMIESMTSSIGAMSLAVGIIAAISLLVGGIGVMNIMLVSVTERTREIGTRKALGARNSAIRIQFIVESMIICLIGGAIGIALGTALGWIGCTALGVDGWPSPVVVVLAVGFSMAIGVFFGYYPANKAASLDPIEALRYE